MKLEAVIQTREPDTKRLAARILLVQAVATFAIAASSYIVWGARHGGSALAGGAIGVIANLYMTFAALRPGGSAGRVLGRLVLGQAIKVFITVAGFVIVARSGAVSWPPLLAAYIVTLVVFWVVPALAAPRLPPRSKV